MEFGNQYSYVLIALGSLLGVFVITRLLRLRWRVTVAGLLIAALVFSGIYAALRPGNGDVETIEAAEAVLDNGNPTLVEFFSNFCAGCLSVRPAVDRLVERLREDYPNAYNILRVDIHTPVGRELRARYGFSFTPEFVLFNRQGSEIWRAHVPPDAAQIARAAA